MTSPATASTIAVRVSHSVKHADAASLASPTAEPKAYATPVVKWAGGKTQLLPLIEPLVPAAFNMYHEPFVGGGALFFRLWSARGSFSPVLIDMNSELINTYCVIRDDLESLIPLLREHERNHSKTQYYKVRSKKPSSAAERAARLIYLNKTCYNGLYRVNSRGEFNVPMGSYKNPSVLEEDVLAAANRAFQAATLETGDFADVLPQASRGDFVYLDPPYYPISATSSFTGYVVGTGGRAEFGSGEHQRLARVFKLLDEKGCYVLLSNSDSPFIRQLYSEYEILEVEARRSINSNGSRRAGVTELVIRNY